MYLRSLSFCRTAKNYNKKYLKIGRKKVLYATFLTFIFSQLIENIMQGWQTSGPRRHYLRPHQRLVGWLIPNDDGVM